ncbi:MAG: superoxide dismutase family protein, partial [Acidimicrobiales bacterium]
HDGDMPLLYANADGVARATFRTDNFTMAQLLDADGSAVIVHALADNYANIPARYLQVAGGAPGPDAATLATGDSGGRQRCGLAQRSGSGYRLVAGDGGVFAFGDARFFGSTGAIRLNQPMVAMAATPSGQGYWLVAGDGGIFAFGDAGFFGSTGAIRLNRPIVSMAATPSGRGYWLLADDGGVFAFGDAKFHGAVSGSDIVAVSLVPTPSGGGYWLVDRSGAAYAFGDATPTGVVGAPGPNLVVRGAAGSVAL